MDKPSNPAEKLRNCLFCSTRTAIYQRKGKRYVCQVCKSKWTTEQVMANEPSMDYKIGSDEDQLK